MVSRFVIVRVCVFVTAGAVDVTTWRQKGQHEYRKSELQTRVVVSITTVQQKSQLVRHLRQPRELGWPVAHQSAYPGSSPDNGGSGGC